METVVIMIDTDTNTDARQILENNQGETYTCIQSIREVFIDDFKVESKHLSVMTMDEFMDDWNDSDDGFEGIGGELVGKTFMGYVRVQI